MFRRQNNKVKKNIKLKDNNSLNVFGYLKVFLLVVFSLSSVLSSFAAIDANSFLADQYAKYQDESPFFDDSGQIFATNLYELSLKQAKNNELSPINDTVTYMTDQINADYSCNLKDSDVSNIRFYYDKTILDTLRRISKGEASLEDLYVSKVDLVSSCSVLSKCIDDKEGIESDFVAYGTCRSLVQEYRGVAIDNYYNQQVLSQDAMGGDVFQNGTLDDSDYDLLVDIDMIGKILFEGFKPSEEVVFYQKPNVSMQSFWNDVEVNLADGSLPLGSTAGYYFGDDGWEPGILCPQAVEEYTAAGLFSSGSTVPNKNIVVGETGDPEIEDFLDGLIDDEDSSLEIIQNVGTFGDVCVDYESCGNGEIEGNEECDDGNYRDKDGCTSVCLNEYCGDAVVNNAGQELCDDGNTSNTDTCLISCQPAVCGDGFVQEGVEECDDGNFINGDGCTYLCKNEELTADAYCGNEEVEGNEECDDGNNDNTDICLSSCQDAICGDAFIRKNHEVCDDGNINSLDGCSSLCEDESGEFCGDGIINGNESCDDGVDNNDLGACTNICVVNVCGDGLISPSEECDDGNNNNGDCCTNDCKAVDIIESDVFNLGNLLENMDDLAEEVGPAFVEGCMADCANLPISDRTICMVECACGEVKSPGLKPFTVSETIGTGNYENLSGFIAKNDRFLLKEGAFKVRFCMIPAESVNFTRGKRVFSIEEIFITLKEILQGLKDSGELMRSVKTKEFLDSSMKTNNFGETFAFNLLITKKPLFSSITKKAVVIKAKKQNDSLEEGILNLSENLQESPSKRNKYVVLANIAEIELQEEIFSTIEDYNKKLIEIEESLKSKINFSNSVVATATMQKNAILNEEVMGFLEKNLLFWGSVNEMFVDILDAVLLLKNKVMSG